MDDCMAMVTVYLKPDAILQRIDSPAIIEPEERHFQCDRIKDHEDDHETWIPTYGYVRFPKKTLG